MKRSCRLSDHGPILPPSLPRISTRFVHTPQKIMIRSSDSNRCMVVQRAYNRNGTANAPRAWMTMGAMMSTFRLRTGLLHASASILATSGDGRQSVIDHMPWRTSATTRALPMASSLLHRSRRHACTLALSFSSLHMQVSFDTTLHAESGICSRVQFS